MNILVINSGSSSLKAQLIKSGRSPLVLAKIHLEEIKSHADAIQKVFEQIDKKNIDAIGHRVVHGGEKYSKPTKIDRKVIREIKKLSRLAPLHNPANLEGILACKKALPHIPQVAVFDTAFHQTMPEKAFIYGIPYKYYKKYDIRRYGFHGTSHKYVIGETLRLLKKKKTKIITCHLGNGASITASINGKSVDTSMGLTPLEGIIMGTRSGSIDPAIIFHLEKVLKMKSEKIYKLLNNESGLKGLSGISSSMKIIYEKAQKKDPRAILTIEVLSYQIAKYCGGYAAAMGGLDAITFTGGLGEKAFYVRSKACKYLEFLGVKIDAKANKACKEKISNKKSKVKVFMIPTNEELQIAKETIQTLKIKK